MARQIAIIGAGMAGLSAGAFLARRGIEVDIFEANAKVGGCCATTNIDGYCFNDGALYIALPDLLDHVFVRIGLDKPMPYLRRISAVQTTHLPDGVVVTIGQGQGIDVRPGGRDNQAAVDRELAAFIARWDPLLRLFTEDLLLRPFSLGRFLWRAWRYLPRLGRSVAAELKHSFSDEAVRAALSGAVLYAGAPPEKLPIMPLVGLVAMLRDGLYLPEGGMGRIPRMLADAVTAAGGRIHLRTRVERIVMKNAIVRGVEVERAGRIEADAVISTVSGMLTFGALLDQADFPAAIRRRLRGIRLSHRAFILQLGLRNRLEAPAHCNFVLPMMEDQHRLFEDQSEVRWPIYMVPTVTDPDLAAAGGSLVEMYPPTPQHLAADEWTASRKQELAGRAVEALRRRHDIDVAVQRILSPGEFERDLHLFGGAIYGISPLGGPGSFFPHRSPVPGLYLAGQTTWPGFGVGPAGISGLLAAEAAAAGLGTVL